ncbi:MAG TPA: hypothetical protein VHQ90_09460 [Thermoanaerobaculia bacterium]|nr:hypothetical protein [Thermoanaerobaculia bacterium]
MSRKISPPLPFPCSVAPALSQELQEAIKLIEDVRKGASFSPKQGLIHGRWSINVA